MALGKIEDANRPPRPNPNFKPTSAQATGYAARKVAAIQAGADVTTAAIAAFGGVAREVVGVAKANPIMGIFLALVGADMLNQAHLIQNSTKNIIFALCGVAFGVEVGLTIVEGVGAVINELDPFSTHGSSAPDPSLLVRPSPTVIVENPPAQPGAPTGGPGLGGGSSMLTALIPKGMAKGSTDLAATTL